MKVTALLTLIILLASTSAHACKYRYEKAYAQKSIDEAYFVGLTKITSVQKNKAGLVIEAKLQPFMVYKASENFDEQKALVINRNGIGLSSCASRLRDLGDFQEVVIFEKDGHLKLGDLMETDLKELWEDLRENAKYAGKE
jgi:hypothetical protein